MTNLWNSATLTRPCWQKSTDPGETGWSYPVRTLTTTDVVIIAAGLIKESLPEILDRTVPDPEHYRILRILTAHFDRYDGFHGYIVRRSGKDLFILLTLGFYPGITLDGIETRVAPLRQDLTSELPGSQVTIIPETIHGSQC